MVQCSGLLPNGIPLYETVEDLTLSKETQSIQRVWRFLIPIYAYYMLISITHAMYMGVGSPGSSTLSTY